MFRIERNIDSVLQHVDAVISLSDSAKDSFGFLADSAYWEQAALGRLWLAIDDTSNEVSGYVLFGGKYPYLKIFQLHVTPASRRKGVGRALLAELKQYAVDNNFLYISAKVATELPANKFWKRMGLRICDQIPAEGTKRAKNIFILELPTTSLLPATRSGDESGFTYENVLQLQSVRYVLDLNVYFDVVRKREYAEDALHVLRLGLSGRIKLAITQEFISELERNSPLDSPDPLLELARAFPLWPDVPLSAKGKLVKELRDTIFPNRSLTGRSAAQTQSDLTHLALSVHYGADGFVTREKAILKKSEVLQARYGLDVVSPADLVESDSVDEYGSGPTEISITDTPLLISTMSEMDRETTSDFLLTLGLSNTVTTEALEPVDITARKQILIAKTGIEVLGVLVCHQVSMDDSVHVSMFVLEATPLAERVIDHFFQTAEVFNHPRRLTYVGLQMSAKQERTYETAFARGFRRLRDGAEVGSFQLAKWAFGGPVFPSDWSDFRECFKRCTQVELSEHFPSFAELQNTGLFVCDRTTNEKFALSIRAFETLSSSFLMTQDRPTVIVPIRVGYAKTLLGSVSKQMDLSLGHREAILRSEKAYFSRPPGSKLLQPGTVVLFYVSAPQGGNKALIGVARVTSANTIPTDTALYQLGRQGVLDEEELESIADKKKQVVATTFDNYFPFPREVPWETLKELGCIGGANLVTAQGISVDQFQSISSVAYSET